MTSDNQIVATQPGSELRLQVFGTVEARPRVEDGWVSRCYSQRRTAPVGVIEAEGSGHQEFVTLAGPSLEGTAPWTATQTMSRDSSKDTAIDLVSGPFRDAILFGDGLQLLESDQIVARASVAFARFEGGRLIRALLVQGTRLETGRMIFNSTSPTKSISIRMTREGCEISIEGTNSFELDLPLNCVGRILVNESRFVLRPGVRRLRFRHDDGQWQLAPETT